MSLEIIILFALILIVIFLFALEVFPVDKIAFFIMVSLLLTGLISPEEAISGFSSPATITVLALMIIAIALEENGVIDLLTGGLKKLKGLPLILMVPVFMFIAGSISGFINTTAVVIVFIKIINELSAKYDIPNSKLLLPVSYAGIIGGSCTLMGTSTNLIVNAAAMDRGIERFEFFEFSWYGIIFMAITIVVVTIMFRFLPKTTNADISKDYDIGDFITKGYITKNSILIGQSLKDTFLKKENLEIIRMKRDGKITEIPMKNLKIKAGDEYLLRCSMKELLKLREENNFTIVEGSEEEIISRPDEDGKSLEQNIQLVEILVLPNSPLIGKGMKSVSWYDLHGAIPVAVRKRRNFRNPKRRIRDKADEIELRVGDRLLVEVNEDTLQQLQKVESITILQEYKNIDLPSAWKRNTSFGILLLVIGLSAFSIFPILKSALIGCFLLIFLKCIDLGKIYTQVNWQIIFLLAGMIPLGVAMSNTGADTWLADNLLMLFEEKTELLVIGVLFFVTMFLSGFISNNATAIIITPIAITIASTLKLDPKPFILAVLFASNFSFFTPVGYQTNTIIYGMGIYRFKHFFIVGGVLSLILWITATLLLSGQL